MRYKIISAIVLAALLWPSAFAVPQRRRTQPRTQKKPPIDFSDVAKAPPEDEVLYDDLDRLLESRWRLASTSARDDIKEALNAYYDKDSITRPSQNHVRAWIKYACAAGEVVEAAPAVVLRMHRDRMPEEFRDRVFHWEWVRTTKGFRRWRSGTEVYTTMITQPTCARTWTSLAKRSCSSPSETSTPTRN